MKGDAVEIARALAVLFEPEAVVELRVPKTAAGTVSGYFDNPQALTKAILRQNGNANVYLTLNPINAALLARSANRVQAHAKTTTADHDVIHRRWLLIDCDPVRPAGVSATDAEHAAALERAMQVRFELGEEGFPAPVLADSGNGAHLLYRIDLPNDDASKILLEAVLKSLAARFSDAAVEIDRTVFNAARICKAYGSMSAKGDSTESRPHRLSKLLHTPASVECVPVALLQALIGPEPSSERIRSTGGSSARGERFDIESFIAKHLDARAPVPHEAGRKWVLEHCPFNPDHAAPDSAVFEQPDGSIGFKCFHSSCASTARGETCASYLRRAVSARIHRVRRNLRGRFSRRSTSVVMTFFNASMNRQFR